MHIFTLLSGICIAYEMSRARCSLLWVQHQVEPKAAGTREEKRECEEALVVSIVYARRGLNVHAPSRYNFKGGQLRLLSAQALVRAMQNERWARVQILKH